MKKREDTVQKFSTFLMFEGINKRLNLIWQTDLQLERHIKRLIQREPQVKAEHWAHHFVKVVKAAPESVKQASTSTQSTECFVKARAHLLSYLQEACLWAAYKNLQKFNFIRHKYPLDELFQIANSAINPPEKLFKSFDVEHPQANLNAYARVAILRFTGNIIYAQDIEAKREKFSDYGLLKDLTGKELKEALLAKGINQNNLNFYSLTWQCFDDICQPLQYQPKSALNPIQLHIEQITSNYNQRCNRLNLKSQTVAQIQETLLTCVQAARDYRTKRFSQLDEHINTTDYTPTLLDNLIQNEEWQEVQSIIEELFFTLPEQGQIMLKLWHGLNLTQSDIAIAVSSKYTDIQKQYQVARYLGRYTRNLLNSLIQKWQKFYPEVNVYDDKKIEIIKDAMDDCLQVYTKQLFFDSLDRVSENNIIDIDNNDNIKQILINAFKTEIETSMQLGLNALDAVNNKIAAFIDDWLIKQNISR